MAMMTQTAKFLTYKNVKGWLRYLCMQAQDSSSQEEWRGLCREGVHPEGEEAENLGRGFYMS